MLIIISVPCFHTEFDTYAFDVIYCLFPSKEGKRNKDEIWKEENEWKARHQVYHLKKLNFMK